MSSKILFQVALDVLSGEKALEIASSVSSLVDILEIGTPLLKAEGLSVICAFRKRYPQKLLMTDTKTMDVGSLEADMVFKAGTDIMSVCAAAPMATIVSALYKRRRWKKKVLVDLIGIDDKTAWVKRNKTLEPDFYCLHTGIDEQIEGKKPLGDLRNLFKIAPIPLAVAGGIKPENIKEIISFKPRIIIVGGYITKATNPFKAACKVRKQIDLWTLKKS